MPRIYTRVVLDISSGKRTVAEFFDYEGPLSLCKGATAEENSLNAQQAQLATQESAFYQTMTDSYKQQFANQNAILSTLQSTWEPILAAGPGQEGFTPAQKTALNTQAMEGTAAEYAKAKQAIGEDMAARGGGNTYLPSGVDERIRAGIATQAAESGAQKLLSNQQASFERGYQNFLAASNSLSGVGTQYNPVGYAGAANSSGNTASGGLNDAFQGASTIQQQNSAGSPWAAVGGLLGGAASAFTGGFGSSLGGALGSKAGGK